jgi:hypothetical protein
VNPKAGLDVWKKRRISIKFSRADSRVKWFINPSVSENNFVSIIRPMGHHPDDGVLSP